ncbi:hypothetical protein AAHE18_04G236700 [Arachis hypogaea]
MRNEKCHNTSLSSYIILLLFYLNSLFSTPISLKPLTIIKIVKFTKIIHLQLNSTTVVSISMVEFRRLIYLAPLQCNPQPWIGMPSGVAMLPLQLLNKKSYHSIAKVPN